MHVLVISSRDISNPMWAGGDVYFHHLAIRLLRMGHEITIVCDRYHHSEALSVIEGLKVHRVRPGLFRLIRNLAFYLRTKDWADVVIEEVEGPAGPFFSSLYVKKPLVGLWHQPARKILSAQYPAPIAALLSALDIVYGQLLKDRAVIVPSLARVKEIRDLGIPESRTFVVPGAAEPGPYSCRPIPCLKTPFFLTLGKVRKYKSFHHAILAMKSIVASHPDCGLLIAGGRNSAEESALRNIAKRIGVEKNVKFLELAEAEKNWALANCVALIVPSPIEGFSLVSIEANSFGKPVIASDGVPSDVVVNGVNGIRYEFGNISKLSQTMLSLLEDPNRGRWSQRCREFALRYSWDKSAQLLLSALESARRMQSNGTA